MIDTIVFDIAKVLLSFDRDYAISYFYTGPDHNILKNKLFVGWEDMDEDLISTKDYEEKIVKTLPSHLREIGSKILNNWEESMSPTMGITELVSELKTKGYKLYVLSNMTRHFIERDYKFPLLKMFDGIVYSAPIKTVKPRPEMYQYLFDTYSLNPKNCLFIDDRKENLVAATRFNMKTFLFDNNVNELRNYILTL